MLGRVMFGERDGMIVFAGFSWRYPWSGVVGASRRAPQFDEGSLERWLASGSLLNLKSHAILNPRDASCLIRNRSHVSCFLFLVSCFMFHVSLLSYSSPFHDLGQSRDGGRRPMLVDESKLKRGNI